MDKQKIKSVPRLTTDNPVDNFQTALNFTDVSEDGWVWLRQPEMALTEYARQLVKGHGSSIDLGCNDMELSESLTDHLFDDPPTRPCGKSSNGTRMQESRSFLITV